MRGAFDLKYPHIQQHDEKDCGAACLAMIADFYGLKLPIARLRELIKVDNMGANMYGLMTGAKALGMDAECLAGSWEELTDGLAQGEFSLPLIARIINEHGFEHYVVVWEIGEKGVIVGDPGAPSTGVVPADVFRSAWQGQIMTAEKTEQFRTGNEKQGSFTKFFKYMLSQKKMLTFVIIMSLLISLINIAGSFVFQYVVQDTQAVIVTELLADGQPEHDHAQESGSGEAEHGHAHEHEEEEEVIDIKGDSNGDRFSDTVDALSGRLSVFITKFFPTLASICLAVIFMYCMRFILEILRSVTFAKAMKLVDIPMTLGYYDHLMELPAAFYGTRKTGEFMARFSDTENIKQAVSSAVLTVVLDSIMAVGCGIFLCWLSPKLFLMTVVMLVLYVIVMVAFRKPLRNINHREMEQGALVTSYVKESIDGIETVKSYHCMDAVRQKARSLYTKLLDFAVKDSILSSVQNALLSVIASVGVVLLLWIGAGLCIRGVLTLAELFMFYYMLSYFLDPVKRLVELQPTMQTAAVAAERLNDVLDAEPESKNGAVPADLKGDIVFSHVDFRYGNRELVLHDLSLVFERGKKTAIVGESGSGKTTVSKLLMKFYEPEAGEIRIGGERLSELNPVAVRQRMSYISQNTFLFADTIYENLRMGNPDVTDAEIEEMCVRCAADAFIRKLPLGYHTMLEENGMNLSGGQRQRLAIARALLHGHPDILIMDEATSSLDTLSEEAIRGLIDSLTGITVIVIAHRLRTVRNCDRIYVLQDGQVAEEGDHAGLLETGGFYAKNWDNA